MDEKVIRNFWISLEKPESLPEGWTWVQDIEDMAILLDAYELIHPNEPPSYLPHYVCAPIKLKSDTLFWYETYVTEEFVYIWRPSICDPEVTESDVSFGCIIEQTPDGYEWTQLFEDEWEDDYEEEDPEDEQDF